MKTQYFDVSERVNKTKKFLIRGENDVGTVTWNVFRPELGLFHPPYVDNEECERLLRCGFWKEISFEKFKEHIKSIL